MTTWRLPIFGQVSSRPKPYLGQSLAKPARLRLEGGVPIGSRLLKAAMQTRKLELVGDRLMVGHRAKKIYRSITKA
jgi:hypothetical protein